MLQTRKGFLSWVSTVAFSRDGKLLASALDDKMVKVWNTESGVVLQTLELRLLLQLSGPP